MKGNSTIKTYKDYLPLIQLKFPELDAKDIETIVKYGWRLLYMGNLAGCDTCIYSTSNNFWFYIGQLCKNPIKHFNYYKKLLYKKMKFLYRRSNEEWDGFYYTALTKEEYDNFIERKSKRGRKPKYYIFKNKLMFKHYDVCNIYYNSYICIIKFKYPIDLGFNYYNSELKCENPEIVIIKEKASTFKDILVSNNNYELL